jgi:hypothetical protein
LAGIDIGKNKADARHGDSRERERYMGALQEFLAGVVYPIGAYPGHPTWEIWTLDYELIHKLVLKSLVDGAPNFLTHIAAAPRNCFVEPDRGLYDLRIASESNKGVAEVEIKVWKQLEDHQITRQIEAVRGDTRVYYVLLGRTATQWTRAAIEHTTKGLGIKVSYDELIGALDVLLSEKPPTCIREDIPELAISYRAALAEQRTRIQRSHGNPDA